MELHLLYVGAGHCSVIRHDNGGVSVVDICRCMIEGGVNPLEYLHLIGVQRVSRFILSRPAQERINGLSALFNLFDVRNFWHSNAFLLASVVNNVEHVEDFKCYLDVLMGKISTCKEIIATAGYTSHLCNIEVLSPTAGMIHQEDLGVNDKALILLVTTRLGQRILLADDIGLKAWRYMFADDRIRQKLRNLDVLIVSGGVPWTDDKTYKELCPRFVISQDSSADNQIASFRLLLEEAGSVIIEDDDQALSVYVMNRTCAQHMAPSRMPVKHPRYEAWLAKRLYNHSL